MAAVTKSCLLTDISQVKIRELQQVLRLLQSYRKNHLLTGLPIILLEFCGKIRITHMKFFCQFRHREFFLVVL